MVDHFHTTMTQLKTFFQEFPLSVMDLTPAIPFNSLPRKKTQLKLKKTETDLAIQRQTR